jgi:hypothetical protein
MRRKKSTQEQQSKSKVGKNSSGSDSAHTVDETKKEEVIKREEMKSIDEWVYED